MYRVDSVYSKGTLLSLLSVFFKYIYLTILDLLSLHDSSSQNAFFLLHFFLLTYENEKSIPVWNFSNVTTTTNTLYPVPRHFFDVFFEYHRFAGT